MAKVTMNLGAPQPQMMPSGLCGLSCGNRCPDSPSHNKVGNCRVGLAVLSEADNQHLAVYVSQLAVVNRPNFKNLLSCIPGNAFRDA